MFPAFTVYNFRTSTSVQYYDGVRCEFVSYEWEWEYNTQCPCQEEGGLSGGSPEQCGYNEQIGWWGCEGWRYTLQTSGPFPGGTTQITSCCNSVLL